MTRNVRSLPAQTFDCERRLMKGAEVPNIDRRPTLCPPRPRRPKLVVCSGTFERLTLDLAQGVEPSCEPRPTVQLGLRATVIANTDNSQLPRRETISVGWPHAPAVSVDARF